MGELGQPQIDYSPVCHSLHGNFHFIASKTTITFVTFSSYNYQGEDLQVLCEKNKAVSVNGNANPESWERILQ